MKNEQKITQMKTAIGCRTLQRFAEKTDEPLYGLKLYPGSYS